MFPLSNNIGRAIMINVPIPSNPTRNQQLPLPLIDTIQNNRTEVVSFEVVNRDVLVNGPNGENAFNKSANQNFTVTIFSGALKKTDNLPLGLFDPTENGGLLREFNGFNIDMQRSYITLTGAAGTYTAGDQIYIIFYVRDIKTGA